MIFANRMIMKKIKIVVDLNVTNVTEFREYIIGAKCDTD